MTRDDRRAAAATCDGFAQSSAPTTHFNSMHHASFPFPAAKKRKRRRGATDIDFDSSSSDDSDASSSSEEDDAHVPGGGWRGGRGGRGGFGRGAPGKKRRSKVKTTCYYINPRYFTDVVKYRLHLMRKHLEGLQRMREGSEAAYR